MLDFLLFIFAVVLVFCLLRAAWLWLEYRELRKFSSLSGPDFTDRFGTFASWVFPFRDGRFSLALFFSLSGDELANVNTALDPDPEATGPGDAFDAEEPDQPVIEDDKETP